MIKNLLIFIFLILQSNFLYAKNNNISIDGNIRISADTILGYLPSDLNIENISDDQLNNYQKKLFKTGFFKSVEISKKQNKLFLRVIESPFINFFYIDGVKSKNILSAIENVITNKENTFFNEIKLKKDLEEINKMLLSVGYYNAKISSSLTTVEDNKVNIFYNIELNDTTKISRIYFIGDKVYKNSVLLDVISSEEHGWWKFLSNNTIISEERILNDIKLLKNFYLNNGYYDAQITSSSIENISKFKSNIIYSINAGPVYKFNKIDFVDPKNILNEQDINYLKKSANKIIKTNYSLIKINKLNEVINDYFDQKFVNKIDYNFNFKQNKSNIDLEIIVEAEINKIFINNIIIRGNNITDELVIRNQLLLSEGDYFNKSKFVSSIDNLKSLKIFKSIDYESVFIDKSLVDVFINVTEMPTGEISAGAGYGSDGGVVTTNITEKNFLGKGINLQTNFSIGTDNISGKFLVEKPHPDDQEIIQKYSTYINKYKFEDAGYNNRIIGTNYSHKYEIYENISFSPQFEISYDSVDTNNTASDLLKSREGDYISTVLSYRIFNDQRDKKFNTTSGYSLRFGQNLSTFVSDIPSLKNTLGGTYYYKIADDFQAKFNTEFTAINAFNDKDVKLSDRIHIRSNNIRGFKNRGIGPKDINDYVGGNYAYFANFSSTVPNGIPDKWNADTSVFIDIANNWGVDYSDSINESNKIRSSIGAGLTWISPLGPLSITYAEPISKATTDQVEQFSFQIGTIF